MKVFRKVVRNGVLLVVAFAASGLGGKKVDEGGEVAKRKEAAAKESSKSTVLVKGGTLPAGSKFEGQAVGDFSIGRTEVTWGEWKAVREWAATKGYDLAGVGRTYPENGGDNLPVVDVNWYDVLKWSNARSEKEGKVAVYEANGALYRTGEFGYFGQREVTMRSGANGYRLPFEREWEWAARGGVSSKGYTHSGSNVLAEVAWIAENSPSGAKAVGGKKANELGLVDMSGNVWEWVWGRDGLLPGEQQIRGGCWGIGREYFEVLSDDGGRNNYPDNRSIYKGFRVAFSSGSPLPIITAQPSGGVFLNGSASLSVSATGPSLSYQWKKDGANISGATSASYTATAAGTYSVVVTNSSGSVSSRDAVIRAIGEMVLVKGGTFQAGSRFAGHVAGDFSIGRTEVTWGEWKAVREWAARKGYDLAGVGGTYPENRGDNLPVVNVSWYDVLKWCNARSEKEGKVAVYEANGGVYRRGEFGYDDTSSVTMKSGANGYRLPFEREWEWAARGGVSSKGYTYSGSDVIGEVAWTYENNTPYEAKAVGGKKANELGLVDMSGNVWEWVWVWDLYDGSLNRRIRGGSGGSGGSGSFFGHFVEVSDRGSAIDATVRDSTVGFRVALSSGTLPPAITDQPSGGVFINGSASLSVSATGPSLSYQWKKDGANISGATSASYTATAAGTYSVVVTNSSGSVSSRDAVVMAPGEMVLVEGGGLPLGSGLPRVVVGDFWIGRTEVTWGEWKAVREWAATKGYDLAGVGRTYPENGGDNLPVVNVSWYDVLKWCNARSEKEGKVAVYQANGGVYRRGEFGYDDSSSVMMTIGANGYRLPFEKEWEWAARGGVSSEGYKYSGGNVLGEVAWTSENSPSGTKAVGGKKANELGLHDMTGNVWELVWDLWHGTSSRRVRGGSWLSDSNGAQVSNRSLNYPDYRPNRVSGFRVALSSGQ